MLNNNVICFTTEKRRRLRARGVRRHDELPDLDLCVLDGQLAAVEEEQAHYRGVVATSDKLSRAYITALLELVALQLRHQALSARRRRLERRLFKNA
jgi:hypothetical protein